MWLGKPSLNAKISADMPMALINLKTYQPDRIRECGIHATLAVVGRAEASWPLASWRGFRYGKPVNPGGIQASGLDK